MANKKPMTLTSVKVQSDLFNDFKDSFFGGQVKGAAENLTNEKHENGEWESN